MQKFEGIHFYVNVANFNEVVIDEESKNGKVNHSIHALDTFFSGIESFGKKKFPEKYVIEKITGARLHMYVVDDVNEAFPIFINYDKQDNISDTTKYEDHFVAENRLIAISKSGRSMDSEDVQNFLNATERGIDVQLFVRKNKDDKISKEFYYLGRVIATGNAKQFVMPNTDKTAVEIEWELETPVREDIYQYIVNE